MGENSGAKNGLKCGTRDHQQPATHIWATFDHVVFAVILGSFDTLGSDWHVTRKPVVVG